MNCSTPGLPVHHQLPEFTQTHVHQVSDAVQPSHPLSSPFPPAFNLSPKLWKWSLSVVSDSLRPHGLYTTRLLCPPPSLGVCSNSCPLSQWCYLTISSSATPFFCLQSFPASGALLISWLFTSGGQSNGALASAKVHPMNIQGLSSVGLTGLISL